MHSGATEVTLGLLILFGLFVAYTRMKNWLDSNVPIIFYVLLILFMQANEGSVPFWLICAGCGLALMLRFEFMNAAFTKGIKFLEMSALAVMLYLSFNMLIH
jgi:hypothetical protein